MITRCPSCRTAFKVVPDQLRIAAGWVRCGHCGELFDGRSHLIDEGPERTPSVRNDVPLAFRAEEPVPASGIMPPTPQRTTEPQPDAATADAEADFQPTLVMEPEEPSLSERLAAERQQALERENEERAEAQRQEAERQRAEKLQAERLEAERAEARRLETQRAKAELERAAQQEADRRADAERQAAASQPVESQAAEAPVPFSARGTFPAFSAETENLGEDRFTANAPATPGEERNEPRFRFDEPAATADAPGFLTASPITLDATPAEPPLPREPALGQDPFAGPRRPLVDHRTAAARDAIPSFVRTPKVHRFWDSVAVRALLWIALPVLIVALAAQWVLHERDWLAARTPALAPMLNTLCAPLGCAVQPYRMLNAIAIDGSDFKAINADTFRFDLSVRNSADVAVAMPAFQLTLSDTQGQVLVRRVIRAAELDAPATLKPHGEFDATRALHIAGVAHPEAITSYRVVAFYP